MNPSVRIAGNVIAELSHLVQTATPALSTQRGDLFPSAALPFAAIRLTIPRADYFAYLKSLPPNEQPSPARIVPVEDLPFDIVVNGFVTVEAGRTAINGRPATLL